MLLFFQGTNGEIQLLYYDNNFDDVWQIRADCDHVHIFSTVFYVEDGYDFVTIDDKTFSGAIVVDQFVSSSFYVTFSSDEIGTDTGFILKWECFYQTKILLIINSRSGALSPFSDHPTCINYCNI